MLQPSFIFKHLKNQNIIDKGENVNYMRSIAYWLAYLILQYRHNNFEMLFTTLQYTITQNHKTFQDYINFLADMGESDPLSLQYPFLMKKMNMVS